MNLLISFLSATLSNHAYYPPEKVFRRVSLPVCAVRMDAPEGSFALIGEGRTKSSSDQIRKERTGRARQAAPGERRTFSSHTISFSRQLNRVPSEKVKRIPKPHRGKMHPAARWTLLLLLLCLMMQGKNDLFQVGLYIRFDIDRDVRNFFGSFGLQEDAV